MHKVQLPERRRLFGHEVLKRLSQGRLLAFAALLVVVIPFGTLAAVSSWHDAGAARRDTVECQEMGMDYSSSEAASHRECTVSDFELGRQSEEIEMGNAPEYITRFWNNLTDIGAVMCLLTCLSLLMNFFSWQLPTIVSNRERKADAQYEAACDELTKKVSEELYVLTAVDTKGDEVIVSGYRLANPDDQFTGLRFNRKDVFWGQTLSPQPAGWFTHATLDREGKVLPGVGLLVSSQENTFGLPELLPLGASGNTDAGNYVTAFREV